METNHTPHSSSSINSRLSVSPDANGYLRLEGNPAPWIENSAPASLLLVKHLQLNFNGEGNDDEDHEIGDSIDRLIRLTHLTVENAKSIKCLPYSMVSLQNLQFLKFINCTDWSVNLGVLKTSLTHLTLYRCAQINFLLKSIATLSNLTSLHFDNCESFTKLPESLGQLGSLKHLSLEYCSRLKSLPNSMTNLLNLDTLSITSCSSLTKLPANLVLEKLSIKGCSSNTKMLASLGQLGSLKHLSLQNSFGLKFLPSSMTNLPNLDTLYISNCSYFTELPENLGQLGSLKHFTIVSCHGLKSLPNSMANLHTLETLSIRNCSSLIELPPSLGNLKHFSLVACCKLQSLPNNMASLLNLETLTINHCFSITELPRGLINLRRLELTLDSCSQYWFGNLKDSVNLHHLILNCHRSFVEDEIPNYTANLNELVNLHILCFRNQGFVKSPATLDRLDKLILLHIKSSTVTYLPWSITEFCKLKFLMLPSNFRLETLPSHLNDSVLIFVYSRHVRKTWNELKEEIGVSAIPIAQGIEAGPYPSIIAPPGYLQLQRDLGQWIRDNYKSRMLVKMLVLHSPSYFDVQDTNNSIGDLPNITHLYVTNSSNNEWLPLTVTSLKHLCFKSCQIVSHSGNLQKLSNLKTLDFIDTPFPEFIKLPISLRCLSLRSLSRCSFPLSMRKLSNLHTLELRGFYRFNFLPPLNIVTLKINRIIKSLPIGLRHLDIVHIKGHCRNYCDSCSNVNWIAQCLSQLVNLEMLSLTCYSIKSLPSMEGLRNLRVLLLKDCFALKELLPDLEQLVRLHTLNISGTRIKSLPGGIVKLSKLQHLTLPNCFTQKLPRHLEEVSIIDDTDKRYYEHMGYYDSDYETITDFSYEGNDGAVGSIEGVDEALIENRIQGVTDEHACEQDDVIAQVPRVLRYRSKISKNKHGITWPSSKRRKQCRDAEGEPNTDSPCLEKPSIPTDQGHERKVSTGATATMATVEKSPMETVKESYTEVPQHVEVHLDGSNQLNIALPKGSSSSFDFVKACYEEDPVWIDFSLTSRFDQLNESVCKKFGLEFNKFKIKYLDVD